jgi:hypothetical protein
MYTNELNHGTAPIEKQYPVNALTRFQSDSNPNIRNSITSTTHKLHYKASTAQKRYSSPVNDENTFNSNSDIENRGMIALHIVYISNSS